MTTPSNPNVINLDNFSDTDDDFVGIKAHIITFRTKTMTFNFIPITAYSFQIPNTYIVIIYLLTLTKITGEMIEAYIPYYLSDGSTNDLRANLIFPFVCFNERNPNILSCPYNINFGEGTLYKYSVGKNLDLSKIIHQSNTQSVGINSVISRIENLLDFIICLVFSNKLDDNLIIQDLISFRPFKKSARNRWNYNFNVIPIKKDLPIEKYLDEKRKEILMKLTSVKKDIEKANIFRKQEVYVIVSDTDINTFNKEYGMVCDGNRRLSRLNMQTPNYNFLNYAYISHHFFQEFKNLKTIPKSVKEVLLAHNMGPLDKTIFAHIERGFEGSTCDPTNDEWYNEKDLEADLVQRLESSDHFWL